MKKINIGLVGFGVVGSGVYELLEQNNEVIKERTNIDLHIAAICDLDTTRVQNITKNATVTTDWKELTSNPDIDIIVELIGGIQPAKDIILDSFKNGKSVVTANKKLLAEEGEEIFSVANTQDVKLGYEASVAGGIPCIQVLKHGLVGNKIKSVIGILNGTTNYILTKMADTNAPFEEVLKDAQEKGFAEADPTFDIEGFDAGHKITLLSMLAYNKKVSYTDIAIDGITKMQDIDFAFAQDMGYTIKLLGISKEINGKLDIRVHPAMLPERHPLATVNDEYNAVMFDWDMTDPILLYGKGAGSKPTASAVVGDIVDIARLNTIPEPALIINGNADLLEEEERVSRYYIRIHTEDQPGLLAQIAGVFGEHKISIASVLQKEVQNTLVPLIIVTHDAKENNIKKAITDINNFEFIKTDIVLIKIED